MRISDWSSDVCSSDLQASAEGTLDFYGLQAQVARCMVIGGEAFVRFRLRRKTDGLTVPLQLQVLEGDYVPFDKNRSEERSVGKEGVSTCKSRWSPKH